MNTYTQQLLVADRHAALLAEASAERLADLARQAARTSADDRAAATASRPEAALHRLTSLVTGRGRGRRPAPAR